MELVWVVSYHGDGGQACVYSEPEFTDVIMANEFLERCNGERGHTCASPNHLFIRFKEPISTAWRRNS